MDRNDGADLRILVVGAGIGGLGAARALRQRGFAAVPAILDTLGPAGAVHVSPIESVTLDRWSRGSVLLIGDAAHATSPNKAEGAAMALEDGLILALLDLR